MKTPDSTQALTPLSEIAQTLNEKKIITLRLDDPEKMKSELESQFNLKTYFRAGTIDNLEEGTLIPIEDCFEFIVEGYEFNPADDFVDFDFPAEGNSGAMSEANSETTKPRKLYYIFENGKFESVDKDYYDLWLKNEGEKYSLEEFEIEFGGWIYSVMGFYRGDTLEGEEIAPFCVWWSESATKELLETVQPSDEFYEPDMLVGAQTFEEAKEHYEQKIEELKNRKAEYDRLNPHQK